MTNYMDHDLSHRRNEFDLEEGITYLNCAYQSPLSKRVMAAGVSGMRKKVNPHQLSTEDFFEPLELLKTKFAQLIHLSDPERIAIHPSVSYGLAIVARNLQPKMNGHIILPNGQFPSNYYAFTEFARNHRMGIKLVAPPNQVVGKAAKWNELILEAINDQTICVTLDHTHWQDGTIFDLKLIREKCFHHNALLIVDGTQSVGAFPINLDDLKPDAFICAGYKFLMGPFGCALSYFGEYFDQGVPIEFNWINRLNSNDFAKLSNYEERYRPKAFRYNVGEFSDHIHLHMLTEAIQQILDWQVEKVQFYCQKITDEFLDIIGNKGFYSDRQGYARHLFGISRIEKTDSKILAAYLQSNKIYVSARGDVIRISPHVYNDREDLMRLAEML